MAPSRPTKGALAFVTDAGRDAMDADAAADEQRVRRTAKSCGPDASTLASSLAVKRETTVTTKPDHRGELEGNRKTIARGMPGVSGVTVVTMLVCFFILHARLRAHRAPGIPCALSGAESSHQTRAHAARTRSRVCNPVPLDREWSEAMDGCASVGSKLDCFAALAMTGPLDREWSAAMDGCASVDSKLDCFAALAMTGPRVISESGVAPERFSDRLLTSARGVGLQRPDAFGQRAAAFGSAARWAGRGAVGRGQRRLCRRGRFGSQHGFDRRVRSFKLDRELRHFGGDVVDAFAEQRIFHALGRPRTFRLLLNGVDVALQLAAFVPRHPELFLDRRLFALELLHRRPCAAGGERDLVAQFLGGAFGRLFRLTQLSVLEFALCEELALRRQTLLEIVDAVAKQFGFLDLHDQLTIEIGDALAQVLDPAAGLRKLAGRLFRIA